MTNEEYQERISQIKNSLVELHEQLLKQKAELAQKIAEEEAKKANDATEKNK